MNSRRVSTILILEGAFCVAVLICPVADYLLAPQQGLASPPMGPPRSLSGMPSAIRPGSYVTSQSFKLPTTLPAVQLRDVLWQALADEIADVFRGPDGRLWYQLRYRGSPWPSSAVRSMIEREFKSPAPRIMGTRVLLFEPGGRVWFTADWDRVLLGYDGTAWIERPASEGVRLTGSPPGRDLFNPILSGDCNYLLAGRLYFPDTRGVHVFDGREWAYQQLLQDPGSIRLMPVPGTPEMLVCVRSNSKPETTLWNVKDGQWSRVGTHLQGFQILAPWSNGRIWCYGPDAPYGPRLLPLDAKAEDSFTPLFEKLKTAKDDAARGRIVRDMISLGSSVGPQVKEAIGKTLDPHVIQRLTLVLEQLTGPMSMTLGEYRLESPEMAHTEPEGRIFFTAKEVFKAGLPQGPGLVIVGAAGPIRFLRNREAVERGNLGGLAVPQLRGIWCTGSREHAAQFLDLETGSFTHALPDLRFPWLHLALPDGTLYVSYGGPDQHPPIMVYRPGQPDDRHLLKADKTTMHFEYGFCVASDGSIWSNSEQGMLHFDGRKWVGIGRVLPRGAEWFLPGSNGEMLIYGDQEYVLLTADGTYREKDLRELIKARRDIFVRSFRFPTGRPGSDNPRIVADAAGNVWLARPYEFHVLVGDRWIDMKPSLIAAGIRDGNMEHLDVTGDGGLVFLSTSASDHGPSWLARVKGERLVLDPGPKGANSSAMRSLRDSEGALWISGMTPGTSRRIMLDGNVQDVQPGGRPMLCDRSGNVWLGPDDWAASGTFRIWRNGQIASTLNLQPSTGYGALVSDRPGSVYIWTSRGLCHCTADPTTPSQFKLKKVYVPDGLPDSIGGLWASDLGYLVARITVNRNRLHSVLHLYPIPEESAATRPAAGTQGKNP